MANNLLQQQLANQAYNANAGTGTLTPYPYGGVMISAGSGGYISGGIGSNAAGWPLWVTQTQQAQPLDPYVPYVTIDTRVEFSEEEIMRAEQIMEECDAARTP